MFFSNYASTRADLANFKWKFQNYAHSIQNDNVNCGVYICMFGQALISGSAYLFFDSSEKNLKKIRCMISQTICNNSG